MPDVRSESVDVEQIMRQVRSRIRERHGADYTEDQLEQLARAKVEKFFDPKGGRADLLEQFRRRQVASPDIPTYEFGETSLYDTHRGLLRTIRRLLNPILKLFINPQPLSTALETQVRVNAALHHRLRQREEMDGMVYGVVQELVTEVTRANLEVQSLKMRVESLSTRMDFEGRRAKALDGVMSPRPARTPSPQPGADAGPSVGGGGPVPSGVPTNRAPDGPRPEGAPANGERRRRRRRRKRRPGGQGPEAAGAWSPRPGGDGSSESRQMHPTASGQVAGPDGSSSDDADTQDDSDPSDL